MSGRPIAERRRRDGIVLVAALLVLVALEITALGLLLLVTRHAVAVRVHERALRVRLAAEDAALSTMLALLQEPHRLEASGFGETIDTVSGGVRVVHGIEALAAGWLLARAEANDADGVRAAVALVLHRRDPLRFARLFTDSVLQLDVPPAPPLDGPAVEDSLAADRWNAAAELAGLARGDPAADVVLHAATAAGECLRDEPGNWGSLDPAHPCYSHVPLVGVEERVRVAGGSGRVVAVVSGELVIGAGARLDGVLLVSGRLDIEHGAVVRGAVTLLPGGELRVHGRLDFDAAAVTGVLLDCAALRRPFAPPRLWLPGY